MNALAGTIEREKLFMVLEDHAVTKNDGTSWTFTYDYDNRSTLPSMSPQSLLDMAVVKHVGSCHHHDAQDRKGSDPATSRPILAHHTLDAPCDTLAQPRAPRDKRG